MNDVSEIVWKTCLAGKPHEKALIVTDPEGERLEIAESLASTCPGECQLMKMPPSGLAGREPMPEVADAMLKADIVVAPTEFSITHTKASINAAKKGARVATMPGITKDIFLRTIPIDYGKMEEVCSKLKAQLEKSSMIRVTSKAGTDIEMGLMPGRKICNLNGIVGPGDVKNLPDGEVGIAPKEGSSNGIIVFDLSALNRKLEKPFKVEVKDGLAISCELEELWNILTSAENGTNLAELGIGTNPKAKITGNILEDEKVLGTAHIAFGTSAAMGGTIQTTVHLDSILDKPTIEVDGKVIIKEGKFLF
jgi:leucyl aminopeptidase (aminopeptidase T)